MNISRTTLKRLLDQTETPRFKIHHFNNSIRIDLPRDGKLFTFCVYRNGGDCPDIQKPIDLSYDPTLSEEANRAVIRILSESPVCTLYNDDIFHTSEYTSYLKIYDDDLNMLAHINEHEFPRFNKSKKKLKAKAIRALEANQKRNNKNIGKDHVF